VAWAFFVDLLAAVFLSAHIFDICFFIFAIFGWGKAKE
jgi:hypothetical protein